MKTDFQELAWISRVLLLNDEQAFAKLVARYHEPTRRFFLMQTGGDEALSDDLAQETFIRVWQRLDSFKQMAAFSTWLRRIAYNLWLDTCRTHHNEMIRLDDVDAPDVADEPDGACEKIELLYDRVAQLSPPERICITMFYLDEMSIKQIVQVTGINEGSVKSHLSRGRNHLRRSMASPTPTADARKSDT